MYADMCIDTSAIAILPLARAYLALEARCVALEGKLKELHAAFHRQGDNMAFVLNHMEVPKQWYEKFTDELAEDRDIALSVAKALR